MLTLSRIFIRAAGDTRDREELRRLAETAYRLAELAGNEFLPNIEHGVSVRVQQGSLQIITTILANAVNIYSYLKGAKEVGETVKSLAESGKKAGEFFRDHISATLPGRILVSRVTTGDSSKLARILNDVEAGEASPDSALERVISIFKRSGDEVPPEIYDALEDIVVSVHRSQHEPRRRRQRAMPRRLDEEQRPSTVAHSNITSGPPERIRRRPVEPEMRREPMSVEIQRNPGEKQIRRRES